MKLIWNEMFIYFFMKVNWHECIDSYKSRVRKRDEGKKSVNYNKSYKCTRKHLIEIKELCKNSTEGWKVIFC